MRKRFALGIVSIGIVFILIGVTAYHYIKSGALIARQKPSAVETFIANHILELSIPDSARSLKNPLSSAPNGAAAGAGRILFQKNCEVCHGFDGKGRTAPGSGLYPPPSDLSQNALNARKRTDGELFYFIRNGIRNTAMPGWQLTDEQTWQLVVYLRHLPLTAGTTPEIVAGGPTNGAVPGHYVGSAACATCHADIYQRWKKTLMANVVRDPREHPEAIIPDLSTTNSLVTFSTNDIALVYGTKWKQRYFKRVGDDYFPFPAQWDVSNKIWRPYFVRDDWWAPLYPPDNFKRPTSATCDGCHSVNYDIQTKTVTEWNVGCERCHGAGSEHVQNPVSAAIINPQRLGYVQANDTCIQCHSQGRPLTNPIAGKYYDWPVGFDMGKKLSDYWKLEEHKLGTTSFTHFADGTAHKNRMQGNDFVTSQMYTHGVTCFTCHDPHGSDNDSMLRKPASLLCLDCHGSGSPNGPRSTTIEAHTHHRAGSAGNECIACHMPKIAQTISDVNVRSHTFRFITPAETDALGVPNACNVCHKDKTTQWTAETLKSWTERSPWRMSN